MSQVEPPTVPPSRARAPAGPGDQVGSRVLPRVVAVYPDHESAQAAVRPLLKEGFDMEGVSLVGRDFQVSEEPIGLVDAKDFPAIGAKTGACVGGLFGLLVGAAFLVPPGVEPVIVAGPLSAAILGGLEGALAGAAVGALSRALAGWGIPRDQALKYEAQVKAGKFLVRGTTEMIQRARALLGSAEKQESVKVYEATAV